MLQGYVFLYNTVESLHQGMNHPNGYFPNVLILLLWCSQTLLWYLFFSKRAAFSTFIEETQANPHFQHGPIRHTFVEPSWHNSPINSEKAAVVNNSAWHTVGDPQVVPVSGLCLPPGGHLHQRSSALWLLDSRKGKLASLFPSYPVREALSTEGVRWGDSPRWLTLLMWCG